MTEYKYLKTIFKPALIDKGYIPEQYSKVKELRNNGLTVNAISEIVGIPKGTIHKWVYTSTKPTSMWTEEELKKLYASRILPVGPNHHNYGKSPSEETRRKLSKAQKGEKNYWYGKHLSEEHKIKISESLKGHVVSEETRQKLRIASTGRTHSEETRLKMSEIHKGRVISEEWRRKIGDAQRGKLNHRYGKKNSEEMRLKLSKALKGRTLTEEHKRRISEANKGQKRLKISEKMKGEKNHRWKGGVSFLPHTPEFNDALKRQIRERDGYNCQYCGEYGKSVHHIDYDKKNCDISNLITLCRSHHARTSNDNRQLWTNLFQAIR